jgi:hypothetical protein
MGLSDDWHDKLATQVFSSANQKVTYEHYAQVPSLQLVPLDTFNHCDLFADYLTPLHHGVCGNW